MPTCDYIIVRGGAEGCVLANWLSMDPRVTVLLLEAGAEQVELDRHSRRFHTPAQPREIRLKLQMEPEQGLFGRRFGTPSARVLGGLLPVRSTACCTCEASRSILHRLGILVRDELSKAVRVSGRQLRAR